VDLLDVRLRLPQQAGDSVLAGCEVDRHAQGGARIDPGPTATGRFSCSIAAGLTRRVAAKEGGAVGGVRGQADG
jgi:hypothetical protein